MKTTRVIIYTKDVQRITGKSAQYCRKLLKKIKEQKAKEDHQYVHIKDFAEYSGVPIELIQEQLVD